MIDQPPLLQGEINQAQLDELFNDLASCAEIANVQVRGRSAALPDSTTSLASAQQLINSGEACSVQIRYRHNGVDWCDTLIAQPTGVRLIRMQQLRDLPAQETS